MNPCESIRQFWVGEFNKFGEQVLPFQCNSTLMRSLWMNKYKELPPIEEMPEKEKKEMKTYVISMFPNKTIEEKLEACKVIYTIGTLL
jgi:hypothetical protein